MNEVIWKATPITTKNIYVSNLYVFEMLEKYFYKIIHYLRLGDKIKYTKWAIYIIKVLWITASNISVNFNAILNSWI